MSDSQYQLQSVFRCSPHVMLSLSFSPDANFLAYAGRSLSPPFIRKLTTYLGYDGVRVFDLKQMRRIYVADRYSHPTGLRHVASNLAWVSFEHTRSDVLVLGCLTGGLTGLVLSRGELRVSPYFNLLSRHSVAQISVISRDLGMSSLQILSITSTL